MNQTEFTTTYNKLGDKCRQVVQLKLTNKPNKEIAQYLGIKTEATVRKHLETAYKKFSVTSQDKRGNWAELQTLFMQFMPELIPQIPVESQPKWVGRTADIAKLLSWNTQDYRILMIVGEGGVGKTTLAEKFLNQCDFDKRLDIKIALELQNLESAEKVVQSWLQQDFGEDIPRDFNKALKLLGEKLRQSKVVVFIDNLETALHNGLFLDNYRDYVELLRILTDSRNQGFTLITSRERLKEPNIRDIQTQVLSGLTLSDWQLYFGQSQQEDTTALQKMHELYNGNAYAMKLLYSEIQNQYDGNIQEFWQQNSQELKNIEPFRFLVDNQLNRLNTHSQKAYDLLCRLAACRYQQIEWLPDSCVKSLLWDVPIEQQQGITRRLYDCSLVQFAHGKYQMHPGIRTAALTRLKSSPQWQQTHRAIAQYWFNSNEQIQTSQQGLQVLEAYHHFITIQDYDSAWDVLRRRAISALPEELFLYFLSWGFIREVMQLAQSLVGKVSSDREASLYRCLGDCHAYLLEDGIETAISYHHQAQTSAKQSGDIWTEFNSYSDMGLCYYIAGEYELGLKTYQTKLELAQLQKSSIIQARKNSSWCEVALLHSSLGQVEETVNAIKSTGDYLQHPQDFVPPWQACWDLNMTALALRNIGNYTQAVETLESVISLAQTFNFTQDRARCWSTLGDIYRQMQRQEKSFYYQNLAIEFFSKVGAKYELGESYYYLGQLYGEKGELNKAKEHYQQAVAIFEQMKTPLQVNKVLACMDN
ncbi:MAG: tetratricopeptide repeat protein [Richelia sp. RM1_1_1]|nr:tetratricopeptide repeat protein [Richelia sp. RM1_1_1]